MQTIVLTGFRATGKSTVGRLVAEALSYRFLDTDQEITRRLGMSVAEVVHRHGWSRFRQEEAALLGELSMWSQVVIATGGGAIEHQKAWQALRGHSFVVWLDADVATIKSRIASDVVSSNQRPALLTGSASARHEASLLMERRAPLYAAGSDLRFDTTTMLPAKVAAEVLAALRQQVEPLPKK